MSRRVKREDLDLETIEAMTDPKTELMKEILEKKYFDEEYCDDMSIMKELNLTSTSFYRYQKQAKELYDWNCQNSQHFGVMRR